MDRMDRGIVDTASVARQRIALAWYGLFVLILASVVCTVNRTLIALVAEPMRIALHLTDAQLGTLNGLALTLVGAIATVPLGIMVDKVDRRILLAACVMIWSGATVAFGLSTSFSALFGSAMGIALGEAVLGSISYSMVADLFPREKWVLANSISTFSIVVLSYGGYALSGALIGWVGAHAADLPQWIGSREPWRATLILSAVSGPVLAAFILAIRIRRTTPPRMTDQTDYGLLPYFRAHARALTGVFVGFGLTYAVYIAALGWTAVILQRTFGETPAHIGTVLGIFGTVASALGVGSGYLGVRLLRSRWGDETPMLVAQFAFLMGLVLACLTPLAATATQFYVIHIAKIMFLFMANSLAPTVLQLIAPARMRGRVIAIGGMLTYVFASVFPWMIGQISDGVFPGPRGILIALSVVVVPSLLAALLILRWGVKVLPATLREVAARDALLDAGNPELSRS